MSKRIQPTRVAAIATVCGAALLAAGCASVDATTNPSESGPLPRPGRIIVYDFAATPADLPRWSAAHANFEGTTGVLTDDELSKARELGAKVAERLVEEINASGMHAVRVADQPPPHLDDIVLVGYFASFDEGSRVKRMVIGFGSGAPELSTHVEGYQMTRNGLQMVGSGSTDSKSGKGPGMIVPALVTVATANPIGLAVGGAVKVAGEASGATTIDGTAKRTAKEIGDVLRERFEREGWI